MPLTPISNKCRHYAIFWNDAGIQVGFRKLKFKEPVFEYDGRKFNFFPDKCSVWIKKGWFVTRKFYQYNINDPNPLYIRQSISPLIDSKTHKAIYDNHLIQDLCDLSENWFVAFLKKYWWLILILGFIIYYLASGHSFADLFSKTPVSTPVDIPRNFSVTSVQGGVRA